MDIVRVLTVHLMNAEQCSVSPPVGYYHLHTPSPFSNSQPKSCYSFYDRKKKVESM